MIKKKISVTYDLRRDVLETVLSEHEHLRSLLQYWNKDWMNWLIMNHVTALKELDGTITMIKTIIRNIESWSIIQPVSMDPFKVYHFEKNCGFMNPPLCKFMLIKYLLCWKVLTVYLPVNPKEWSNKFTKTVTCARVLLSC